MVDELGKSLLPRKAELIRAKEVVEESMLFLDKVSRFDC